MPSFWERNVYQNEQVLSNKKKKKNREKRNSFDEAMILSHSSIISQENRVSDVVLHCLSPARASDSFRFVCVKHKIGHPLPLPLPLPHPAGSFEPWIRFDQVQAVSSYSPCSSVGSPLPTSSCDNNFVGDQSQLDPCRNLSPGSRASPTCMSPTTLWGTSLETSPTGKQEHCNHPSHPLPLPPSSPTGVQCLLSNWKRGRLLGRGTFGNVYAGFNSENGQMCAIKEVKIIFDDKKSQECLKQLNQEISLLSQLSHPNIVQYYGCELGGDKLSVYLEYVSGGSIHKLLKEYGAFGEPVVRCYTRKILSGLAYLHGRNTAHRDIKGANILVDPNGEIKLADFGMAKHIDSYSSTLSFKGSPYWMAPEVIMNARGYSLAVDIWSLGCTVLEMATAKPPWSQYEAVAAMFKIANGKDFPVVPNELSDDTKNFIEICLQRNPSARPTAAQLLHHPFLA